MKPGPRRHHAPLPAFTAIEGVGFTIGPRHPAACPMHDQVTCCNIPVVLVAGRKCGVVVARCNETKTKRKRHGRVWIGFDGGILGNPSQGAAASDNAGPIQPSAPCQFNAKTVHKGALAFAGLKKLLGYRAIDHGMDGPDARHECCGDAPVVSAFDERRGAVDGIGDPQQVGLEAVLVIRGFLRQPAIGRAGGLQAVAEKPVETPAVVVEKLAESPAAARD